MFDDDVVSTPQRDLESLRGFTPVFLGGSRRMAQRNECEIDCIRPAPLILIDDSTDYDYYATFSERALDLLRNRGWTNTGSDKQYYDSEAVEILEKENYQIVLRKCADFYHKTFEQIPVWYYHDYLWKRNPCVNREMIQPIIEMLFAFVRGRA